MSFRGSGRSQAEIMRSLKRSGKVRAGRRCRFWRRHSAICWRDRQQPYKAGASLLDLGSQYTTPFDKLAGLFTVNKGVLTIGGFSLNSTSVIADGSGRVDIGQQSVDFSLQPTP